MLPAPGKLGELWDSDVLLATKTATAFGYVLAAELRACGIDMSFTPVLDLNYGQSKVIGDRALHAIRASSTMLAKSLNQGLALAGMANCGKHFPGHGFASADSHVRMPVDDRPLEEILAADVEPYDWLGMSLGVGDSRACDLPAGRREARRVFRASGCRRFCAANCGFNGAIFSDDLSMEAARAGRHADRSRAGRADGGLRHGADLQSAGGSGEGAGATALHAVEGIAAASEADAPARQGVALEPSCQSQRGLSAGEVAAAKARSAEPERSWPKARNSHGSDAVAF